MTDNLGLRAIYDIVEIAGGPKRFLKFMQREVPRKILVVSLDASVPPKSDLSKSARLAGPATTVNTMSGIQIHRYNAATKDLIHETLTGWAEELSKAGTPVEYYFVQLSFNQHKNAETVSKLEKIPTAFTLDDSDVDLLIDTGKTLLRQHPEFIRFLKETQN